LPPFASRTSLLEHEDIHKTAYGYTYLRKNQAADPRYQYQSKDQLLFHTLLVKTIRLVTKYIAFFILLGVDLREGIYQYPPSDDTVVTIEDTDTILLRQGRHDRSSIVAMSSATVCAMTTAKERRRVT
jgi:hypothetical protein